MSISRLLPGLILLLLMSSCTQNYEFSQWRGPDRNGKYADTGLMKEWPAEGPELLWSFEGLGAGHGSVSIADGKLFLLGMPDTIGIIYCLNLNGELLWKKEYGLEWHANYTGPRSTPTIKDGLLYFVSGQGKAICMDTKDGEVIWSRDMFREFDAQPTSWGIAESPVLDGDRIIITPGGKEHNLVALNRFTGETLWSGKGFGEQSAYCSPILVEHNQKRLIVTMTAESILGIDAESGQTYWRVPHIQGNKIHANSPVYEGGRIFCASASSRADSIRGHVMIELSGDGTAAEVGWRNTDRFNLMGGIVLHEGNVYSSTYEKKEWYSLDAATGNLNYLSEQVEGGVNIYADGLFYNYGTDGVLSLIEAGEEDCRVISSFKVPLGTEQHWAHPVIHDRKLYVHHGDALMCYDIAAK